MLRTLSFPDNAHFIMHVSALLADTQRWMEPASFTSTESSMQQTPIAFLQAPMTDAQTSFGVRGGVNHGTLSKRSGEKTTPRSMIIS